jgi:hypothetical protein
MRLPLLLAATLDAVACGTGTDTAQLDSRDVFGLCEDASVANVGKLRLAPATLVVEG